MGLFRLIDHDVLLEPGRKIISETDYAELKDANTIVKNAHEEVKKFKEEIKKEAKKIKETAYKKGFDEGLAQFNERILELDKEIKNFMKEMREKIVPLSISVAKKILGEELQISPERIINIVAQALKQVKDHRQITIYVNPEDLHTVLEHKKNLEEKAGKIEILSIQERPDIKRGGCVIVTERGMVNLQLEKQMEVFQAAIEQMMKK